MPYCWSNYYYNNCCCCCSLEIPISPLISVEPKNITISENRIDDIVSAMNECDIQKPLDKVGDDDDDDTDESKEWVSLMKNLRSAARWLVD
jgi:hypothetical protein